MLEMCDSKMSAPCGTCENVTSFSQITDFLADYDKIRGKARKVAVIHDIPFSELYI